jgi:hypothetical protein
MNSQELQKEIERLSKSGGCDNCRYSYGSWYLCNDCRIKLALKERELKGRTDMIKEILEIIDDFPSYLEDEIKEELKSLLQDKKQ